MASGVLLTVHVAPVLEGRIVAFVLEAGGPKGSWLPWTVLPQGGNPYEIASTIVDQWCDGAMSDLRLVDVISRESDDGWELAVVFRAELTALPRGERGAPRICEAPDLAAVQGFEAVDLERWLESRAEVGPDGDSSKLVF
ncbi:MAG: hypothetical protein F4Z77_06645 [Dehalococcoidia bacterium]|nr:hypothetical protein [Dehalococcoidia bacterium]MYA54058.1 hypothetical protein [Dehalococcoidia bacterium]